MRRVASMRLRGAFGCAVQVRGAGTLAPLAETVRFNPRLLLHTASAAFAASLLAERRLGPVLLLIVVAYCRCSMRAGRWRPTVRSSNGTLPPPWRAERACIRPRLQRMIPERLECSTFSQFASPVQSLASPCPATER